MYSKAGCWLWSMASASTAHCLTESVFMFVTECCWLLMVQERLNSKEPGICTQSTEFPTCLVRCLVVGCFKTQVQMQLDGCDFACIVTKP